jgi:hypothetical protein
MFRILLFLVALFPATACAFNALGHRVVAEIAWQQLTPERRQEIVDTLKRHPRFGQDFILNMPPDVAGANQPTQDRWIFWQAAVWPDVARGIRGPEKRLYDRGTWHYINGPIYLDPSDRKALAGRLTNNMSAEYPTRIPEDEWNIIQATQHAQAVLRDKQASAPERAIAYCWLFHLAGDSHQPLHSCALFSASRFPKGDRGGNDIPLRQGRNLHSLWDNLLGRQQGVNDVKRGAAELSDREQFGGVWKSASENTDIRQWLSESYALAKSFAYDDAILTVIRRATPQQPIEGIELSEAYLKAAGRHARERVLAAGIRLAAELNKLDAAPGQTNRVAENPTTATKALAVKVVNARLVPFTMPDGTPTKAVVVEWRNTGSLSVRAVDADIVVLERRGRALEGGATDYTIYAVSDSSTGIEPGANYTQTADKGFILDAETAKLARRVRVKITEVLGSGAF